MPICVLCTSVRLCVYVRVYVGECVMYVCMYASVCVVSDAGIFECSS